MSLIQLVLDLFDPPARLPPNQPLAPAAAARHAPEMEAPAPCPSAVPVPAPAASPATPRASLGAPSGALPLHECLAPVVFRHPQANRELLLQGAVVGYALARARRRTIGFTVGAEGLSVRAPVGVTLAAVDAALRKKSDWILRKLAQARERQQRQEHVRIDWGDGAVLPYFGAPLTVVLDPAHPMTGTLETLAPGAPERAGALRHTLRIGLVPHANAAQVRDAVQAWLMRQAQAHFTARLNHFAPLLGVQWRSLRLSSAQTRWGTAKSDGSIRLNWRLLHHRPAVIDYVVAHELAHLRVMNHSPDFWRTVATVVPDHAALRRRLRDEPAPRWEP